MDIILCGAAGRMGREIAAEFAAQADTRVVAAVDKVPVNMECASYESIFEVKEKANIIVDFSHRSATYELVDFACSNGLPIVIATTGQTDKERKYIEAASEKIPIFFCGNMSFGVMLFISLAGTLAKAFPYADIEIVETHRRGKADAPSGTALMIAKEITAARGGKIVSGGAPRGKGDIGISSVRVGDVAGIHEVRVDTGFQTFVLRHEAHSRALFLKGTLHAVRFLSGVKKAGLYGMKDFL